MEARDRDRRWSAEESLTEMGSEGKEEPEACSLSEGRGTGASAPLSFSGGKWKRMATSYWEVAVASLRRGGVGGGFLLR